MKFDLKHILIFGIIILGTWIVSGIFHKSQQSKNYFKELLAEKDSALKREERITNELLKGSKEDKETANKFIARDTVYITRLKNNDKKLQDIITTTRNASKDELRRFGSGN